MNKTDLLIAAIAILPTAILTSCDDDDKEPEIPVVDCVTVKDNTVAPGDTVKAELKLIFQGKYVKVTYAYATSPSVGSGQFECGSSQDHTSFSIPIASEADTLLANSDYRDIKLTVTPIRITAYAGDQLYYDPQMMKSTSTTFTLEKKE